MNTTDVQKLADLARLSISDEEALSLSKDMENILGYIKQIEQARVDFIDEPVMLVNVVREDIQEDTNQDTNDQIIANMPDTDGRFLKVKKIL